MEKLDYLKKDFDFGTALVHLKDGKRVRLPYWSEEVYLELQIPDKDSKMTHSYIIVKSRFGLVPWVAAQIEMLSEMWGIKD